jgi:type IV pilus assembly protein PilC
MPSFIQKIDNYLLYHTGVPLTQKVFFTENLRVMIRAGLSISEGLSTLALQADSKTFRRVITVIKNDVESGKPFSASCANFPKIFASIFVSMIQIGEVSGTLEESLSELTQQMKKDYEIRSKVKGAMTYPIVVLTAMVAIGIGLVVYVLPQLLVMFTEFGGIQLPLATRILIFITDFTQAHGILVVIAVVVFVIAFICFARTKTGKSSLDWLFLHLPILGPIVRKVNLARFSRTVSGLMHTDIPVVQAFGVTAQVLGNTHFRAATLDAAEHIKKGESIAKSLGAHGKLFPPLVVQMVLVGERAGTVDELLADIADFYEQQVEQTLNSLSSIIEPVLILILGVMVGGIALAIIAPIYSMTESIS